MGGCCNYGNRLAKVFQAGTTESPLIGAVRRFAPGSAAGAEASAVWAAKEP